MATTRQLIDQVKRLLRGDPSYTDEIVLEKLNNGLLEVSGLILLPDLLADSPITAEGNQSYVDLPEDFHREVFLVASGAADGKVNLNSSWQRFLNRHPTLDEAGGNISEVVVRGQRLYYQPRPTTRDTLTVHYYRKPAEMTLDEETDAPDGVPVQLQTRLLVSYAAREFFDEIEDGIEGPKINWEKQNTNFFRALSALKEFVGPADGMPQEIEDDESYIQ